MQIKILEIKRFFFKFQIFNPNINDYIKNSFDLFNAIYFE